MSATRTETDSIGAIEVPADAYWGAQTQRSIENFPFGATERMPIGIVHAQVNPRLRRAEADAQDIPGGYAALPVGETAIEMSYGIQLRRWLSIRPDVQYILDPGAFSYRRTNDALALGGQVKMQF